MRMLQLVWIDLFSLWSFFHAFVPFPCWPYLLYCYRANPFSRVQ